MRCRRNSEDAWSRGGEGVQVGLNHPKKWTVNKRSEQENTDRVEWAETRTRVSGDRREAARMKRNVHTMAVLQPWPYFGSRCLDFVLCVS